jgi:hypothetical protein
MIYCSLLTKSQAKPTAEPWNFNDLAFIQVVIALQQEFTKTAHLALK